MFYIYNQNNSGGKFIIDDSVGQYVIIEADSAEQADDEAQVRAGIYFDGCETGPDCPCCGDRWYRQFKGDGTEKPMIYGKTIEEFKKDPGFFGVRQMVIHIYYQDGRHEKVQFDALKALEEKRERQCKEARKLWGNVFSTTCGLTNKRPIRLYEHQGWGDEPSSVFSDKSGNRSMEKGLHINSDFGWVSFTSESKKEVEDFMEVAKEVTNVIKSSVLSMSTEDGVKKESFEAIVKLINGMR